MSSSRTLNSCFIGLGSRTSSSTPSSASSSTLLTIIFGKHRNLAGQQIFFLNTDKRHRTRREFSHRQWWSSNQEKKKKRKRGTWRASFPLCVHLISERCRKWLGPPLDSISFFGGPWVFSLAPHKWWYKNWNSTSRECHLKRSVSLVKSEYLFDFFFPRVYIVVFSNPIECN